MAKVEIEEDLNKDEESKVNVASQFDEMEESSIIYDMPCDMPDNKNIVNDQSILI